MLDQPPSFEVLPNSASSYLDGPIRLERNSKNVEVVVKDAHILYEDSIKTLLNPARMRDPVVHYLANEDFILPPHESKLLRRRSEPSALDYRCPFSARANF